MAGTSHTVQLIVIFGFLGVLLALGSVAIFIRKPSSKNTLWALTLRIGLSVSLLIFILVAVKMGWLQFHGLAR